jgi:hypothetical protein
MVGGEQIAAAAGAGAIRQAPAGGEGHAGGGGVGSGHGGSSRGGPYSKDPGRGVNPAWQGLLCAGGAGDWGWRASRAALAGKLQALEVADVGADGLAHELAQAEIFGLGAAPPAIAFAERDAELNQPEAEIFHAGCIAQSSTGVLRRIYTPPVAPRGVACLARGVLLVGWGLTGRGAKWHTARPSGHGEAP